MNKNQLVYSFKNFECDVVQIAFKAMA